MEIEIKKASISDIEKVRDIAAYYIKNTANNLNDDVPPLDDFVEQYAEVLSKDLPYLVAKVADEVIGFSYVVPYRKRSAYRYTVESSVYVHPNYIGKGVAKSMLNSLINYCKKLGYKRMVAVISSEGEHSIAFHTAMGFRQVGRLEKVAYKFSRWIDIIFMQKDL